MYQSLTAADNSCRSVCCRHCRSTGYRSAGYRSTAFRKHGFDHRKDAVRKVRRFRSWVIGIVEAGIKAGVVFYYRFAQCSSGVDQTPLSSRQADQTHRWQGRCDRSRWIEKAAIDRLFCIYQQLSMLCANISRLFRRSWITTKRLERLASTW